MITAEDVYRIRYLMNNNKLSFFTDEFFNSLENAPIDEDEYITYKGQCSLYSVIFSMIHDGLDFKEVDNLSDEFIVSYVKKELSDELIVNELKSFIKLDISFGKDFHELPIDTQNFIEASTIKNMEVNMLDSTIYITVELSI